MSRDLRIAVKVIDRAKALITRAKAIAAEQAIALMGRVAMNENKKIAEVARSSQHRRRGAVAHGIESRAPKLLDASVAQYMRSACNISANWSLAIRYPARKRAGGATLGVKTTSIILGTELA